MCIRWTVNIQIWTCICSCTFDPPPDWSLVIGVSAASSQDEVELYLPLKGEREEDLPDCDIKLLYCQDPRRSPKGASYCSESCGAEDALRRSFSVCKNACGDRAYCGAL